MFWVNTIFSECFRPVVSRLCPSEPDSRADDSSDFVPSEKLDTWN